MDRFPIDAMKQKFLCYVNSDFFLFSRNLQCYKCFVFFDRHPNILQFQEG